MRIGVFAAACAVFALMPSHAGAADATTIQAAEHPEHGIYLTDGQGRSVYLFESDKRGDGDAKASVTCSNDCMEVWPPVTAEAPKAGEGIDAGKLGTISHDGMSIVTYAGWPLYYFVKDEQRGDTKGQDIEGFGAEWYLITPAGEKAGH